MVQVFKMLFSSVALHVTRFFALRVQLIFPILLQHHISKLRRTYKPTITYTLQRSHWQLVTAIFH